MKIERRAEKNLKPLEGFRAVAAGDEPPHEESQAALGVYENPDGKGQIWFTDRAAYVQQEDGWVTLPYDEVATAEIMEGQDKMTAESITVVFRDGRTTTVRVAGGAGRFRDVYGVHRFLRGATRRTG